MGVVGAAITLGITIGGFCITIITIFVKKARQDGQRDQRLTTIEKEQENTREKIRGLYSTVNLHDSSIQVLTSNINTVKDTTERIENKIDRINEIRGSV